MSSLSTYIPGAAPPCQTCDLSTPHDMLSEANAAGKFVRVASGYREVISKDHSKYQPEFGRYQLFVSYACPWANRCVAIINMKGLQDCIKIITVHPTWQKSKPDDPEDKHYGWAFYDSATRIPLHSPTHNGAFVVEGCSTADVPAGVKFVRDLYEMNNDTIHKYTVPVLWDSRTNTIVNNESSEILRMLNDVFDEFATGANASLHLYPKELRNQIDAVNEWVYPAINDGVYKSGFAKSQLAYEEAVTELFNGLDRVETILGASRYLVGNTFTEADLRLFMTLVRFDEVYVVYFKCNVKRISDYENIRNYLRDIYQMPGMATSIRMDHIKTHYYTSHPTLNSYAIVPRGPNVMADLVRPHNRAALFP